MHATTPTHTHKAQKGVMDNVISIHRDNGTNIQKDDTISTHTQGRRQHSMSQASSSANRGCLKGGVGAGVVVQAVVEARDTAWRRIHGSPI